MSDSERGQVSGDAARVYEEFFVPALFGQWAGPVADAAGLRPGQRVLDVACGTGVLAREAARRVGPAGAVVGVDPNEGMLAVAAELAPEIEWRRGIAGALPFDDAYFDAVVSQFGMMFFEDRRAALGEMKRVLRPGGRMAVAVWDGTDNSPGYAAMTALLQRLFGDGPADALRAPFNLGDAGRLAEVFRDAGLTGAEIRTLPGTARFPSIEAWVHTDVKGWTLAGMLDDAQYETLENEARRVLREFAAADGSVSFAAPAHVVVVRS